MVCSDIPTTVMETTVQVSLEVCIHIKTVFVFKQHVMHFNVTTRWTNIGEEWFSLHVVAPNQDA